MSFRFEFVIVTILHGSRGTTNHGAVNPATRFDTAPYLEQVAYVTETKL